MMQPIIIIGGGGHARVLIDALQAAGHAVRGVVDPALAVGSNGPLGIPVLGGDEALAGIDRATVLLVNGVGSTRSMEARDKIHRHWLGQGFRFASVVHPSAVISRHAQLADGAQAMAGSVIQCGATIGANTIINTRASVDHDCRIGVSVHIAPGVTLSGAVTVGDATHIGTGATVIQGVVIGRNNLIPAGTVVRQNVPDDQRLMQQV